VPGEKKKPEKAPGNQENLDENLDSIIWF